MKLISNYPKVNARYNGDLRHRFYIDNTIFGGKSFQCNPTIGYIRQVITSEYSAGTKTKGIL